MGGDGPLVVEWVYESECEESVYVWIHLACDRVRPPVRRICDSTWCKESDVLNAVLRKCVSRALPFDCPVSLYFSSSSPSPQRYPDGRASGM
jgi:hypothetical protein